jgi:tripartite-type tricarboxylate transporter receptor subunit TctC
VHAIVTHPAPQPSLRSSQPGLNVRQTGQSAGSAVGLFAPTKTPTDVAARLHQEVRKALQLPAVQEHLAKLGVEPMDLDQQAFSTFVHQEIAANAELVRDAGIKVK